MKKDGKKSLEVYLKTLIKLKVIIKDLHQFCWITNFQNPFVKFQRKNP